MVLETIVNNLRDGFHELEPGTFLHSAELLAEQVENVELQNQGHYVADGPLYGLREQKLTLWLTRLPHNLVLRHLGDAENSSYDQLTQTGNYYADPAEAEEAIAAPDTVEIDIGQLRLEGKNKKWRYLNINTNGENDFNPEETKLVHRMNGEGAALQRALEAMGKRGIQRTGIRVLNPLYVAEVAREGVVGRAAWRSYFNGDADAYAVGGGIDYHGGLRGVRRLVAVGDAVKNFEAPVGENSNSPSMKQMLTLSESYVPKACWNAWESEVQKVYKGR